MRKFNTTKSGSTFNVQMVEAVWRKGRIVSGYDPNLVRIDACGAWLRRDHYGNTNSEYGWEIDHVFPVARGGSDDINNLQPLQWQNNRHKGDSYPSWSCAV